MSMIPLLESPTSIRLRHLCLRDRFAIQSKACNNLCLFNLITPWVCLQFTGRCNMMQLPLAAGQQGRLAFKLLSGFLRLHLQQLSIEGLWQRKRTHPIKRSGYLFYLECNLHSHAASLVLNDWHPNLQLTCAGKICHQRKVI